ncbi:MAG TPA: CHAT domain-containing protein, partial [Roseiflexaceae bacterium]|nr:CHAT domain-containing protein [Roseiflexaceae bacterium]
MADDAPKAYAELEVGLHHRDADVYTVEPRFIQPDSDDEKRLEPGLASFNIDELDKLATENPAAYGKTLANSFFADANVKSAFDQARASAGSLNAPLRLRLFIGPSAPDLHNLRWETLCDPQDGTPLLMGEQILFSRYLSSADWRRVQLRPQGTLRALVVIANPNLERYPSLTPLNVQDELGRATTGLGNIKATALFGGSANLNNILTNLREGYDILYIVAHGTLKEGEPYLWLEDEQGAVARVSGKELESQIKELADRPRLVALISCQSAGTGTNSGSDGGALAGLGPRLAKAGIPAVIAMQGNVSFDTIEAFLPVFFAELQRDGQIDRAIALARGRVRDQPDAWMPALFLRLRSGRMWYDPGFIGEFEKWPALLSSIESGECTPLIGTNLSEALLGSSYEIAGKWAETYRYPMAPHEREDLPQVAQFVAVNQDLRFLQDELSNHIR